MNDAAWDELRVILTEELPEGAFARAIELVRQLRRGKTGGPNSMDAHAKAQALGHWKCISPRSNADWRRDDGLELVGFIGQTNSYTDGLKWADKAMPEGTVEKENLRWGWPVDEDGTTISSVPAVDWQPLETGVDRGSQDDKVDG